LGCIFLAALALHRRHTLLLRSNPRASRAQCQTWLSIAEAKPWLTESNPLRYAPLGAHSKRAVWSAAAKRSFGRHSRLLFAPLNPNKVFATLTKYL